MPEAANRLLFDLTHALARQVELLADLLESHLRGSDAEKVLDDVALTLREGLQRTVHLGRQRLVDQPAVGNIDATVVAQAPKLKGWILSMREKLAAACGVEVSQVSVKATTEEGLGFTGSGEGIAAHAVCLLLPA